MVDLVKDVNPNDVTVAGVIVQRPSNIGPSEWMEFWEASEDLACAIERLEAPYMTGCKDNQGYRRRR